MDRRRRALVGLLTASFVACQSAVMDVDLPLDVETWVPSRAEMGDQPLGEIPIPELVDLDLTSVPELQGQGLSAADVASARLTVFTVSVTTPEEADLSFLDAVAFFVESADHGRVQFASAEGFPAGLRSVDLTLDDVDLGPFLTSDAFSIRAVAAGHLPDQELTLQVSFVLNVGVTAQGACTAARLDRIAKEEGLGG